MDITLTVSPSPSLSSSALQAFADKAKSLGKDPSEFLAALIEREVSKRARHPKPKKGASK